MENTANALPQSPPEPSLNPHQYEDEELLLLHLTDINNDPLPSDLEAAVEGGNVPRSTSARAIAAPLLMERPKTSGIDVASFSFSKPLKRGNHFSLRSSKTQQPTPSVPQRSTLPQDDQHTTQEHGECVEVPVR